MEKTKLNVIHVVRRLVSEDLSELKIGYDLEHFIAMSKLMSHNTVIFQSKDGIFRKKEFDNMTIYLLPSLWSVFWFLVKIGKSHDILVAQNPFVAAFLATLASFFVKKPVLISVHGYEFSENRLHRMMKKFVCRRAFRFRAISEKVKQEIISWGIYSNKIDIVEDRVDCNHFNPLVNGEEIRNKLKIKNKMALSIGSLIEIKGFDTLLEAIKLVKNAKKDLKFIIIGEGSLRNKLERNAKELKIDDCTKFIGKILYEETPKYYAASDLFIHPSNVEAMGRVILEAEASQKPVIATNVGGIPEAVNAQSAILVPPKNPQRLAEEIIKVIDDESLAIKMGEAGRRFVLEKFEFWKQEEKLISLYEKIIQEATSS